tara:strand:- start:1315 stop:1911 length:597 start_codon:yes stop_codon:yes gene_type:complete
MSKQKILKGTHSAISLQVSVGGATPYNLQVGPILDLFGQVAARASPLAPQANNSELPMTAICGPHGSISYASAALQLSLVNKLKQQLTTVGSTLFSLIWKEKATPLGRRVSLLRLSALSTTGRGFGLLPTPSGTSNHGKNHVSGRLDEWGGSGNQFRGTELGKVHCVPFELWLMGYSAAWAAQMPQEMPSSRKLRNRS